MFLLTVIKNWALFVEGIVHVDEVKPLGNALYIKETNEDEHAVHFVESLLAEQV